METKAVVAISVLATLVIVLSGLIGGLVYFEGFSLNDLSSSTDGNSQLNNSENVSEIDSQSEATDRSQEIQKDLENVSESLNKLENELK